MMRRIFYIIDEALLTVKRHKGLTSISIVIMSLSLLMLVVWRRPGACIARPTKEG